MAGKLTTVLAKKEADAYRSQGLHHEAIEIFNQLLARSPNIDPVLKKAVEKQISGLAKEREAFVDERNQSLSAKDIVRIKQGWGHRATETDHLVCAKALQQVGAYQDAFQEFLSLFQSGTRPEHVVGGMAACLVHLTAPDGVCRAVDTVVQGVFKTRKPELAFRLLLGKTLARQKHTGHALALFRELADAPDAPPALVDRLQAVLAKYTPPEPQPAAPAPQAKNDPPEAAPDIKKGRLAGLLDRLKRK